MTGIALKNCRKILDWTQEDVANRLEVTIRTVQYWENNQRNIPKSVELYFSLLLKNDNEQTNKNTNNKQTFDKVIANEFYKLIEPKIIKLILEKTAN